MPETETDLMVLAETFLGENLDCPVGIIRMVDETPDEIEYPFVGILDGGDNSLEGASEGMDREILLVVSYEEVVGNPRDAVLSAKARIRQIRTLLETAGNFDSTGAFSEYQGVKYKGSSEGIPFKMRDSNKSVAVKLGKFEFQRHICFVDDL
ncbi:MAG: hypothetical protein JSV88_25615 [Candidatus Aminicenantes bacterium]|nr:MAG: hypothetical protein JSV88_25615 [Candidatus Aminicenantes bacterium]